jgi:hypothetical protein
MADQEHRLVALEAKVAELEAQAYTPADSRSL